MAGLDRLIYIDDSYEAKHSGTMIFGWVECHPIHWRTVLRAWLETRKKLFADFSVPPSSELHATHFINGRGNLITETSRLDAKFFAEDGTLLKKDLGREVARHCLAAIRDCPELSVGAVFHQTDKRGADFAKEKYALYGRLVSRLDRELAAADSFGLISMDGGDAHFLEAHRDLKLDERHIIEDPTMHDSRRSQWVQMADLIAYTALMSLNRHATNEFGWSWYDDYLADSDVNGTPLALPPTDGPTNS